MLTDRLALDDLGWRDLWAYITAAPPGTALHYAQSEGWGIGDRIGAEQLYALRELVWRYTALHFKGGKDRPFPEPIPYPGAAKPAKPGLVLGTVDEMVSPQVRKLLAS